MNTVQCLHCNYQANTKTGIFSFKGFKYCSADCIMKHQKDLRKEADKIESMPELEAPFSILKSIRQKDNGKNSSIREIIEATKKKMGGIKEEVQSKKETIKLIPMQAESKQKKSKKRKLEKKEKKEKKSKKKAKKELKGIILIFLHRNFIYIFRSGC